MSAKVDVLAALDGLVVDSFRGTTTWQEMEQVRAAVAELAEAARAMLPSNPANDFARDAKLRAALAPFGGDQ